MKYDKINECRICRNKNLVEIIDLGTQALTGVFPPKDGFVDSAPIVLVKCHSDGTHDQEICGLVQLQHNYDMSQLYGDNYGYRSGLNPSMVKHLGGIVEEIEANSNLMDGDLVIDIASNDGTLLGLYKSRKFDFIGVDPTSEKFKDFYKNDIRRVVNFFSFNNVEKYLHGKKAKIITTIAMFYDLPDPLGFMQDVSRILENQDGRWIVEQSYLPIMLRNISYDTLCHEHLEYYAVKQFSYLAERSGLKIIDISENDSNGGSFRLTLAKKESSVNECTEKLNDYLNREIELGLNQIEIYNNFKVNVENHKIELIKLLDDIKISGGRLIGYGASTKGNVILQYCGIGTQYLDAISEVNPYKFGRVTPGTEVEIVSEEDAQKLMPTHYLVLPWHFKDYIIKSNALESTVNRPKYIFPMPIIEIV